MDQGHTSLLEERIAGKEAAEHKWIGATLEKMRVLMAGTQPGDLQDLLLDLLGASVESLDTIPDFHAELQGSPERAYVTPACRRSTAATSSPFTRSTCSTRPPLRVAWR